MQGWTISPYPAARDFAFTIIHDADDSYSRRLAPLFDVFDELSFKLSVTAFAFWRPDAPGSECWPRWSPDDPFFAPLAVPLEDPGEREFYLGLVERGHEIGLHTPSDGDDLRNVVERAFETFRDWFGHFPRIYVEHHKNRENLYLEGARPGGPYYIVDLLNRYRPWFWGVSPSALPYNGRGRYYDVLSTQRPWTGFATARLWGTLKSLLKSREWDAAAGANYELLLRGGSPFDEYLQRQYGVERAFRRSGRLENSHGEGFCEWYSAEHVADLEQQRGLALVYTHLNTRWLDRETRRMKPAIRQRLEDIASRNVWLAPASVILDRFEALQRVSLAIQDGMAVLTNAGDASLDGLTIRAPRPAGVRQDGVVLKPNSQGLIDLGTLPARATLALPIVE